MAMHVFPALTLLASVWLGSGQPPYPTDIINWVDAPAPKLGAKEYQELIRAANHSQYDFLWQGKPDRKEDAGLRKPSVVEARSYLLELIHGGLRKQLIDLRGEIGGDIFDEIASKKNIQELKSGKVVEEGPSSEVFERPQAAYTKALLAAAFELAVANRAAVAS